MSDDPTKDDEPRAADDRATDKRAAGDSDSPGAIRALDLKIGWPGFTFPQIGIPNPELLAAAQRWQQSLRPLFEIGDRLQRLHAEMVAPFAKYAGQLQRLTEIDAKCERLERLGWMPHASSPLDLTAGEILHAEATDQAIHAYYQENWERIGAELVAGIEACGLDAEAKAAFAEAVAAHGAGLYRCAPRLVFPEIERVSRKEIHGGAMDKMASQQRLVHAIGSLTPAEMSGIGVVGLRFYKKLTEHLYVNMKDDVAVRAALLDPVPNRHAAVHGIVSYTSPKSSLNSILVADYLLRAIATIKKYAAEDAADQSNAA